MNNQTDNLQLTDIKVSSYLLSKGIILVSVLKNNPRKVIFCFPNSALVKKLLKDYWSDQTKVSPKSLFDNLDHLKNLIHQSYEI